MGKQRKTWSTDVKEAIVLSVLRGELGVAEAARQHGVNESLIHTWKTQFLEAGRARLAGDRQDQGVTSLERENDRLKRILAEKELELAGGLTDFMRAGEKRASSRLQRRSLDLVASMFGSLPVPGHHRHAT